MSQDTDLFALAESLGQALLDHDLVVSTAESCTGGWIAKAITDVAGSSGWFEAGFVTYSNAQKTARLGVHNRTLTRHGAVSAEVVTEMARGALAKSGADLAVAVSGVAGPDGGSDDKPVGTVWIAWARHGGASDGGAIAVDAHGKAMLPAAVSARCYQFDGDREAVRRATVEVALEGLKAAALRTPQTG